MIHFMFKLKYYLNPRNGMGYKGHLHLSDVLLTSSDYEYHILPAVCVCMVATVHSWRPLTQSLHVALLTRGRCILLVTVTSMGKGT